MSTIMEGDICTFCYRQCFQSGEGDCDGKREEIDTTLKLFGKLVERYLGGSFRFIENSEQTIFNVKTCEDCVFLLKGFCELYHEWKCLELRLEWSLRKMRDVMNSADKVRSRREAFRASFIADNLIDDDENRVFNILTKFRRNFKGKLKLHEANCYPRVLLHRKRFGETTHELCGKLIDTLNVGVEDVSSEESFHFRLGWITTFAALFFLSHGFEKPTELNIDDDMGEFLNNSREMEPSYYDSVSPRQSSPQPNFGRSEMGVGSPAAEHRPIEPLSQRLESENLNMSGGEKKLRETHGIRKIIRKRRKIDNGKFACRYCSSRRFNSYQLLLKHQKAFTHVLTRKKFLSKPKAKRSGRLNPLRRRIPRVPKILTNQTELQSPPPPKIKSILENIGVLRPQKCKRKRGLSSDKSEREDVSDIITSDTDDHQEWKTSSTEESSSSSNSSDCESTHEDDVPCSFCNKVIRSSTLVRHQKACHSNPVNSQLQTKRKRRRVTLDNHICDISLCTESFNFKEELENHKKRHGSFFCAFCGEVLAYAPDLALHEKEHSKNMKIEAETKRKIPPGKILHCCARCNYSTYGKSRYIEHFLQAHLRLPQPVMCPICRVWRSERRYLKSHIARCHGNESDPNSVYTCDQCPAYFLQNFQLIIHQKTHPPVKKEKNYACTVDSCKKAFVTEKELIAHKILHASFPCKFCAIVESYAPNLALHEMIHRDLETANKSASGEYGCARCNFHTYSKRKYVHHHLIRHLQLRLGSDFCSICQVPLLSTEGKKTHFLTHHSTNGVDPKSVTMCRECPAYFLKRQQLHLHKKRMHNKRSSDESSGADSEGFVEASTKSEKPFVCRETSCRERFECEELLALHKKMHGTFSCQFCSVKKSYALKLAIHELSHSTEKVEKAKQNGYNCARCNYQKSQRTKYIEHFVTRHLDLPAQRVMCGMCKILFTKKSLRLHYKAFHDTKNVDPKSVQTCGECSAPFLKRSQLDNHIKKFHLSGNSQRPVKLAKRKLKCCEQEDCNKVFELSEDLENHQKLHGTFTCSLCPVVELYAPNLALHEITHLPSSSAKSTGNADFFNCSRCTSTAYGKFQFVSHFLEVHLKLPSEGVTCKICREKFSGLGKLGGHIINLHNTEGMQEEDIPRCDQCPAYFRKWSSVLNHMKKIHGEDPLTCIDCGKKCKTPKLLRQHRKNKHKKKESEFTFVCVVSGCEKRFETKTELEWHKNRIHNSKGTYTTFVCHVCGKKCLGRSGLTKHMMLHSTRPPSRKKEPNRFVCDECGKFFIAPILLERHKLSHSGPASWPFSCLFCGKRSQTEDDLYSHLRTHTKEKAFICEYCGEEYAHAHNLRNHKNKKHDANDLPKVYKAINARVSRKGQKLPPRLRKY